MGSFGGGLETLGYEFDPNSIVHAISLINKNIEGMEGTTEKGAASMKRDWESVLTVLTKFSDKSKNSADSYIRSLERQAAAIGKSGIDKLNAQMDQAIKNYGYSESAINKITAAYHKLAEAQEKGSQGFGAGTRAGMGARDLFEGRNAYAAVEFGKGLTELKGAPAIIGGITAAFGAAAAAGYELVKSSAEEARELNNLAVRTGLTVEAAETLSIQAKIAGVDINSLERSAVQLSRGLEDASGAGKKQADALRDIGISTLQASGQQKEMGDVLSEVLQKLSQIPDTTKRLYEAQLLLGRGAKELQPMIVDLETLKSTADQLTQSLASGANEELLKAARQISTMDEAWSIFKKNLAAKIAPIVIPVVTYFSNHLSGNPQNNQSGTDWVNRMTPHGYATAGRELGIPGLSYAPSASATAGLVGGIQSSLQSSVATENVRQQLLKGVGTTPEALEAQIADKKQQMERDLSTLNQKGAQDAKVYTDAQKDLNKALGQQIALENELKALQASKSNSLDKFLTEMKAGTSSQNVSALQKVLEERDAKLREFQDQFNFLPKAQLDAGAEQITKAYSEAFNRALGEMQAKSKLQSQKTAEDVAKQQISMAEERLVIEKSITDQITKQVVESSKSGFYPVQEGGPLVPFQTPPGMGTPPGPSAKEQLELTKDMLAQESRRIELSSGPGGELAAARQIIDLKKQSLAIDEQQAEIEAQSITNQFDREKKIYEIRLQYSQQVYDAESEYQDKLLEKQKQLAQLTAGLYHTLLTNPSKFPKQLANTVKESALKPVTEGLGNITSGLLAPLFYGTSGGLFGSKTGLSDVQSTNGALHVFVTNPGGGSPGGTSVVNLGGSRTISIPSGGGGGVTLGSSIFGVGDYGGSGYAPSSTSSLPLFGASSPLFSSSTDVFGSGSGFSGTGAGSLGFGSFGGFRAGGGGGNPFGTALGFAKAAGVFGTSGGQAALASNVPFADSENPLGPQMATGGSAASGFGTGAVGNLKGGLTGLESSMGYKGSGQWSLGPNQEGQGFGAATESIATSPMAGTAGMMLASAGLLGNNRGTGAGIAEGTAGGALIGGSVGMQLGGPMGALIGAGAGAAAGLLIGVSEDLLGLQSPENKVKSYVKSIYHLSISTSEANKIVGIAQQKYGSNYAVAVRSPEVRQMLGIYAAGTGQKNNTISATTPQAGSLVEQGGKLFQQATYQYGQAYTYQSNLPVLGGPVAGNYPNTSPSVQNVSISLNGQSAADALEGRVASVVTPSYLADGFSQANANSDGRTQAAADLSQPGLITS